MKPRSNEKQKPKITSPDQIRINGEIPSSLVKKVKLTAEETRKVISDYKKKNGMK